LRRIQETLQAPIVQEEEEKNSTRRLLNYIQLGTWSLFNVFEPYTSKAFYQVQAAHFDERIEGTIHGYVSIDRSDYDYLSLS
jgi:hypothetical protein